MRKANFSAPLRGIKALGLSYQKIIHERFYRLLPFLLWLMSPEDIFARNRTWPGVSPIGKGATRFLSTRGAAIARRALKQFCRSRGEDFEQLWSLFRAYCRFGPIALADALPSELPPLVPDELGELAVFHRLAKHPRSDAGIYIRQLLDHYASELDIAPLQPFVARYAWANDARIERWFVPESAATEHVARTTRRIVMGQDYPHQCWLERQAPLPFAILLSRRHPLIVQPWLIWLNERYTDQLMGYWICAAEPTPRDLALTLRWSIWHFDAHWWPVRGVPDTLVVPEQLLKVDPDVQRALAYLHIELRPKEDCSEYVAGTEYSGWPEIFTTWIQQLQQQIERQPLAHRWTMAELNSLLLDHIKDSLRADTSSRATPTTLQEQDCSLPWSTGISAALLLPSAGRVQISSSTLEVRGIPYGLTIDLVPGNSTVDVRYDPADARQVYVVIGQARVKGAIASAFEHRTSWYDLVDNLELLDS